LHRVQGHRGDGVVQRNENVLRGSMLRKTIFTILTPFFYNFDHIFTILTTFQQKRWRLSWTATNNFLRFEQHWYFLCRNSWEIERFRRRYLKKNFIFYFTKITTLKPGF
jgi:hypothetical protein